MQYYMIYNIIETHPTERRLFLHEFSHQCRAAGCHCAVRGGAGAGRITQQVTHTLELSESTLYPVLRRLQKDQLLTVYDAPFNGRNRRYYQITSAGRAQLAAYAQEWSRYRSSIDTFFREVE